MVVSRKRVPTQRCPSSPVNYFLNLSLPDRALVPTSDDRGTHFCNTSLQRSCLNKESLIRLLTVYHPQIRKDLNVKKKQNQSKTDKERKNYKNQRGERLSKDLSRSGPPPAGKAVKEPK
ncbi:hypothetical protein Tco_1084504 [Tanacetum coccineum]